MSSKPLVSVVIPAYNYAHFLPYTIKNVLQESDIAVEIIVVDDGSTDKTADVVRFWAKKGPICYIHQTNQGLSAARNTGIRAASGEYVVFLDADDLLAPGTLAAQAGALARRPEANMAVCRNLLFTAEHPHGPLTPLRTHNSLLIAFPLCFCFHNVAPVHAFMLRRSLIEKAGFFDTSLRALEDYDYWLKCLAAGARIIANTEGCALYRQHGGSMSRDARQHFRFEFLLRQRIAFMLDTQEAFTAAFSKVNGWVVYAARCFLMAKNKGSAARDAGSALAAMGVRAMAKAEAAYDMLQGLKHHSDLEATVGAYHALMCKNVLNDLNEISSGMFEGEQAILKKLYPESALDGQEYETVCQELENRLFIPAPDISSLKGIAWQAP